MRILTLETSCDETAAAIVTDKLEVLGAVVASQQDLHQRFGGVVPEIASRAHVQRVLPVVDETLRQAGLELTQIDAVAVVNTPGLAGSLLIGLAAAKSLCLALGVPLIAVNHLQAHIYACQMSASESVFPAVGLIVSGGHSNLYRCRGPLDFTLLGATVDDAAGEAFDKVASMLGLSYPGGPSIQQAAAQGSPTAYPFPRAFLHDQRLDFSFSGLKTAVRYALAGPGAVDFDTLQFAPQQVADVAASFQAAVVDILVAKSLQALEREQLSQLCVGGGVAANALLRSQLTAACEARGISLHIPPLALCTDNAVMAAIAVERLKAGLTESLDLGIQPGLVRNS